MKRYRLLYNGDHWRAQYKSGWWPFWRWVGVRYQYEDTFSPLCVKDFATDIEARAYIDGLRAVEAEEAKRTAPYTLAIEL